jgi:flavin-binding protein dodecin
MSENHVAKVIEVVGTSDQSIEDAIESAVTRTASTIRNLQWFHVTELRGALGDGGKVERYQVVMRVGFGLDDD